MQGGDVPVPLLDLQQGHFGGLVLNAVLLEGQPHVKRPAQPLPAVAASMLVVLLVPLQDLADGLFLRHFQFHFLLRDRVVQPDFPGLPGEIADDIAGVLPPFDLHFGALQVQVLPIGAVELSLACFRVYPGPWLPAFCPKPGCDVGASRPDDGVDLHIADVFLHQPSQIVDLPEQHYPAVIRSVVLTHFFPGVVSLLSVRRGVEPFGLLLREGLLREGLALRAHRCNLL